MSSWHQHHATGVYGECCIGDCSPGDLCYYTRDRRGCPHNPVFNRFVTVGSIKYGVRVGAVSPPPPGAGARYRGTAVSLGHHHHYHRHESSASSAATATDKECCCNVVNLPWPRSVASASVSRIPLLADKQQLSINSCGIFSSVNSVDMSNGYAGCSSLPLAEREREREREHTVNETTQTPTEADAVYRSRPSWSHPPQFGLRSCVATTATEHLRFSTTSSSSSSFSFLQRRRVLVRSRSDADANSLYDADDLTTTTVIANDSDSRRNTLDRLHRFRFGGNRGNVRGKKRSEEKSERLRELTDRLKNATHLSSTSTPTSTAASHKHTSSPPVQQLQNHHHAHLQPQPPPPHFDDNKESSFNPVPPPRTRHSQSSAGTRTSTPTVVPSSTAVVASPSLPPSPPPVVDDLSSVKLNLPKPEARTVVGSYMQRTIPFRSASFSLVDFSSDGKYFRKRNTESESRQDPSAHSNDSISRAALTLPRKKENQVRYLNSASIDTSNSTSGDKSIDELFEIITKESKIDRTEHSSERTQQSDCKQEDVPENISDVLRQDSTKQMRASDGDSVCSTEDRKRDRSRRRKGMYISQWPDQRASVMLAYAQDEEIANTLGEAVNTLQEKADEFCTARSLEESVISEDGVNKRLDTNYVQNVEEKNLSIKSENKQNTFNRVDSFSEGEIEQTERRPLTPLPHSNSNREHLTSPVLSPSDVSDTESRTSAGNDSLSPNTPRRYSKRPLRGPYGQMLEAEMKRPDISKTFSKHQLNSELKFLDDLSSTPAVYQRSSNPNMAASMMSLTSGNSVNLSEPKSKTGSRLRGISNHSLDDSNLKNNSNTTSNTAFTITTPTRKISGDVCSSAPNSIPGFGDIESGQRRLFTCHQRTTSSPSKLEEITLPNPTDRAASAEPSSDFLCEFLRTSSEQLTIPTTPETGAGPVPDDFSNQHQFYTENYEVDSAGSITLPNNFSEDSEDEQLYYRCIPTCPEFEHSSITSAILDTRTHIVVELYETERSYVESLQILVMKYLEPLKSAENSCLLDAALVDEIFYQVPALLSYHKEFLEELRKRLEHWDVKQKIGDVFLDLTKPVVVETYTSFINNWKRAKEVIKTTSQAKPAFARFLEAMAREHKGKLALDSLLIKPVQKFPKYELLIQRLIKHTDSCHPDYPLLLEAQKEIHENLIKINCTERETVEYEQQQQNLRELEGLVEGLVNLVTADRVYLRHDLVTMASGQGTRKERALFLFSDLLVITSIKRRSGTIKKPAGNCPGSVTSTLDANKYKLLMRIPLDDLEIMKGKDENVRRVMLEIENLQEDINALTQINDLILSLHCSRGQLEDVVKEMLGALNRQLAEQQNSDSQLSYLDLTLNTQNGVEHLSIVFSQPEKRASWEESFNEAKQKLAISVDRRPSPEFLAPVPIRKTRAGLQFTCAAPTLSTTSNGVRDVWVCNSDGYVGQVCVLSLHPEPTVTSCNGVCNARILCVASVPAGTSNCTRNIRKVAQTTAEDEENRSTNIQLDSSSSSADEEDSEREDYVENRIKSSLNRGKSIETASTDSSDDTDCQQPTMWLGTEDGCIHVYNCNDNIRIKKNKIRLQHGSSILCIIYLDNRVFVSMANGDITIYSRDQNGGWNTSSPMTVSVSTAIMPVNKMLPNSGKLWCSCNNVIRIFNIHSLTVEHTFQTNGDQNKSITCMVMSGLGVWLSLHNSAVIKCFHSLTYEFLCEVNMAPAVTKMLTSCDDIIRQHKAACLRVTSLLACKDLLWVGTSAGVLLTMPLSHITTSTTKISVIPCITGVPHGHTGHVRFLTCMESPSAAAAATGSTAPDQYNSKLLVISGGDGYEDFRSSNMSDVAGREDSTNHLLLWHV